MLKGALRQLTRKKGGNDPQRIGMGNRIRSHHGFAAAVAATARTPTAPRLPQQLLKAPEIPDRR